MIVKMKKASLVILDSMREQALEALREAGIVHLSVQAGRSGKLAELEQQRIDLVQALQELPEGDSTESADEPSADQMLSAVLETAAEKKRLREMRETLLKQRTRQEPLGDFDPDRIRALKEKGIDIRLFRLSRDEYRNRPAELPVFTLAVAKGVYYIAAVPAEAATLPDWSAIALPEASLSRMNAQLDETERAAEECDAALDRLARNRSVLEGELAEIEEQITFEEVHTGLGQEGELAWFQGYVPVSAEKQLKKLASDNGWALILEEPGEEDPVPTLVENPRAIRIINPVFALLGTVPGYRERDISFFFLIFLSIFFAMIIGDAGYGTLFFLASGIPLVRNMVKRKAVPDVLILFALMSFCTILWGAVTGNWFGSSVLGNSRLLSTFIIEPISNFNPRSAKTVQLLCFIIGTVHLSISHIWNFLFEWKKFPRIKAFTQLGWLSMVLGLYYMVLNLVLDPIRYPVPQFAMYMIFGGLIVVFLFSNQEGNFFKGVLKGFGGVITTFLDSISAFSDIISYIRLFAVGLAGVAISQSFNAMAAGMSGSAVGAVVGILVLILGHTLNIAMSALSVLVHGVRLNVLEFSSHLGMEWTGESYTPFSRSEKVVNIKAN